MYAISIINDTKTVKDIPDDDILNYFNAKYPQKMWRDKWEEHMNYHVESGKRKCYVNAIPNVELTIKEYIEKEQILILLGHLYAKGKRGYTCSHYCGKFKIKIPDKEEVNSILENTLIIDFNLHIKNVLPMIIEYLKF